MKLAPILLAVFLTATAVVRATEALQNVDPTLSAGAVITDEVGFSFRPAANVTINALGYTFDVASLPASYVVQVLDQAGGILASATLSTSNAPGSQFIYTNIPPLSLAVGSTNYLTAYDAAYLDVTGMKSWTGYVINEIGDLGGTFDVASGLDYLGATIGTALYGDTNASSLLFVGPNFQFTVLETSRLSITLTSSNTALVSWPATDTLGQLQCTPDLATTMTNVTTVPTVVGPNKVVEWPSMDAQTFFQLKYP